MEFKFFLFIIVVLATVSFMSWLISRSVFRTLTKKGSNEAKLISAVIFLVAFLILLITVLYIMDLNHAFDKYSVVPS